MMILWNTPKVINYSQKWRHYFRLNKKRGCLINYGPSGSLKSLKKLLCWKFARWMLLSAPLYTSSRSKGKLSALCNRWKAYILTIPATTEPESRKMVYGNQLLNCFLPPRRQKYTTLFSFLFKYSIQNFGANGALISYIYTVLTTKLR